MQQKKAKNRPINGPDSATVLARNHAISIRKVGEPPFSADLQPTVQRP
jgi:hypothetical protein